MAFKLYEFKCKTCEALQEQLVENTDGKAEEPCVKCNAPATDLFPELTNPKHSTHISWSLWKV